MNFVNSFLSRQTCPRIRSKDLFQARSHRLGMLHHHLADDTGDIEESNLSLQKSFDSKLIGGIQDSRRRTTTPNGVVGQTKAWEALAIRHGKI